MPRIYVDTNVYRDLFEGRKDRFRDLGEFALFTFRQVREGKYQLVVSDWVIEEFKRNCDEQIINKFLDEFKQGQVIRIMRTKEDEQKAHELSPSNYSDALHVILAKKGICIYLITQNLKHFAEFSNLIEVVLPESL
jgi:predicted nucleic acid-binding protein